MSGRIGYQVKGGLPQFAGVGETVVFKQGVPHRFWNDGEDILHCKGYVKPANTIVFYLSSIYAAQNKTGTGRGLKNLMALTCSPNMRLSMSVFYLSSIYAAQNKTGTGRPEKFDGAYLLTQYASEYEMAELPKLVKRVIIPITYYIGRLLGKYKHFKNAPQPVKNVPV